MSSKSHRKRQRLTWAFGALSAQTFGGFYTVISHQPAYEATTNGAPVAAAIADDESLTVLTIGVEEQIAMAEAVVTAGIETSAPTEALAAEPVEIATKAPVHASTSAS